MGSGVCNSKKSTETSQSIHSARGSQLLESTILLDDDQNSEPSSLIEISLKCKNLITDNRFSLLNPVVHVLVESGEEYIKKAETDVILKSLNPIFTKKIRISYSLKYNQRLKFELYNYNQYNKTKDLMGSAVASLHEIASKPIDLSKDIFRKNSKNGTLVISAVELSSLYDIVKIKLELQTSFKLGHCILKLIRDEKDKTVAYQTESQDFPYRWDKFSLTLNRLCKGDETKPILCEMISIDNKEKVLFSAKFTIALLKSEENPSLEVIINKTAQKLQFTTFTIKKQTSFIQYLQSGVKLNPIYGIDFSTGYGHGEENSNCYLQVINIFQDILQFYSNDSFFLTLGSGAVFNESSNVSNFFAVSGNIFRPRICNTAMLSECYKTTLLNISPTNETKFSFFFRILYSQISYEKTEGAYQVVVFVFGSDLIDQEELLVCLRSFERLPVSIIFVGLKISENIDFPNIAELVKKIHLESSREYLSFGYQWEVFSLLEAISSQALSYFKMHPVVLTPRENKKVFARSLTMTERKVIDKINGLNDFYANYKNVTLEKMKESGFDQSKIFEIENTGMPFYIHEVEHGELLSPVVLRSSSIKTQRRKSIKICCVSCGNGLVMPHKASCGCSNLCPNCYQTYKCKVHSELTLLE